MYESENKTMNPDEELVDILLDCIIVAANLANATTTLLNCEKSRNAQLSRRLLDSWVL